MGVVTRDPASLAPAPPANALDVVDRSWVLSGCNLFENGRVVLEDYGHDLDDLDDGDRVGVCRHKNVRLWLGFLVAVVVWPWVIDCVALAGRSGVLRQLDGAGRCGDGRAARRLRRRRPLRQVRPGHHRRYPARGAPHRRPRRRF